MKQHLAQISIIVKEYDAAIEFYTQKMGFLLLEDTPITEGKRWVRVCPPGSSQGAILLAKAGNAIQEKIIGNQTGGRVFLFLHTDDFWRDYHLYNNNGIHFLREPAMEAFGTAAVFEDLYGNLWELIQPNAQ